jgi:hypothetical protein
MIARSTAHGSWYDYVVHDGARYLNYVTMHCGLIGAKT